MIETVGLLALSGGTICKIAPPKEFPTLEKGGLLSFGCWEASGARPHCRVMKVTLLQGGNLVGLLKLCLTLLIGAV